MKKNAQTATNSFENKINSSKKNKISLKVMTGPKILTKFSPIS